MKESYKLVSQLRSKAMINIEEIKDKALPILKRYGVTKAALFGSFVRREMKDESDIDILVEIQKDISLLDFVGLKLELEETLGRKVDVVEYSALKPILKERVLSEQVPIL
jgi:predicted nucleotidyltransferase